MNNENIFFDTSRLKYRGSNVIIGKTVRIRYPELVELHDDTIVDDFVYISTGLIVNKNSVIEPGCVLMGGKNNQVILESSVAIAPNCTILCASNDFKESFAGQYSGPSHQKIYRGSIIIKQYTMVGAGVTILPGVTLGEGCRVGANSLVKTNLDPWTLYAGSPVRKLSDINKEEVLRRIKDQESGTK